MFTKISRILYFILFTTLLLINACVSHSSTDAEPLLHNDYSTSYQFSGHPDYPSRLSLSTHPNGITYSAQVSDFAGKIITTVNNTTLQTMEFIIPIGEKKYYVNITTQQQVWLDNISLRVNPITKSSQDNAQYMTISYSASATICELWVTQSKPIYLYTQPSINTQPILIWVWLF